MSGCGECVVLRAELASSRARAADLEQQLAEAVHAADTYKAELERIERELLRNQPNRPDRLRHGLFGSARELAAFGDPTDPVHAARPR